MKETVAMKLRNKKKKERSLENLVRTRDVCKPYDFQVSFASIFPKNLYET